LNYSNYKIKKQSGVQPINDNQIVKQQINFLINQINSNVDGVSLKEYQVEEFKEHKNVIMQEVQQI
jgi:hypothetical protein